MMVVLAMAWVLCAASSASAFLTDTDVHTEPTAPSLPSAGSKAVDPTFGSAIIRLTDRDDSSTDCTTHYSNLSAFNSNNSRVMALCVVSYNRAKFWDWDPITNTRSNGRIQANPPSGFRESLVSWRHTDPDKYIACANRVLYEITIPAGTSTTFTNTVVRDFSTEIGGSASDYCDQQSLSNNDDIIAFSYKLSTVPTGYAGFIAYKRSTNTILLHEVQDNDEVEIDKTGRWLMVQENPHAVTIWDLQATPPTSTAVTNWAFFHRGMGFEKIVSNYSSQRLAIRTTAAPNTVTPITPVDSWIYEPQQDHFSIVGNSDAWMLACRYHNNGGGVTNAYDNECLQIATDGSQNVRRFVHNRTRAYGNDYFSAPKSAMSFDGRYFTFTSNWDGVNTSTPNDVYIVDMYPTNYNGDLGF